MASVAKTASSPWRLTMAAGPWAKGPKRWRRAM